MAWRWLPALVPSGLAALAAFGFSWLQAPTREGRKLMDQIEGFRQYLDVAEEDRLEYLNPPKKTPELFEKFLPYAIALDCENTWAKRFAGVLAAAGVGAAVSSWYVGDHMRTSDIGSFTDRLGDRLADDHLVGQHAARIERRWRRQRFRLERFVGRRLLGRRRWWRRRFGLVTMRCDCHVHIVGPADKYPQVPERAYLAGVASVETLQRLGATRGISRFVIVQPSFYGADNSATLDALDALGGNGRGVAVIDPAATSSGTLAMYHRRGVRGLRINLYSPIKPPGGDTLEAAFAATAEVAQTMGWHVQVIAPLPVLLANAGLLAKAKVPW